MNQPSTSLFEKDLEGLEQRKRGLLLNSLAGFRPAILVGTCSEGGGLNLAIFNSLIHFGANPALWGLVLRPEPLERDTFRNILYNKSYTLNYVTTALRDQAHQCSAKHDRHVSEFEACGIKPEFIGGCKAPFVAEAVVKIQMEYVTEIPVPLNDTTIMIGKPVAIHMQTDMLCDDGFVDLSKARTLGCQGLDAYIETRLLDRFEYAHAGQASIRKKEG